VTKAFLTLHVTPASQTARSAAVEERAHLCEQIALGGGTKDSPSHLVDFSHKPRNTSLRRPVVIGRRGTSVHVALLVAVRFAIIIGPVWSASVKRLSTHTATAEAATEATSGATARAACCANAAHAAHWSLVSIPSRPRARLLLHTERLLWLRHVLRLLGNMRLL